MIIKERNKCNKKIENNFNISNEFLDILIKRGYDTEEKIRKFLYPSFDALYNPFLFRNMKYLIDKINYCIDNHLVIVIYGDYDVDGTMATSSLYMALKSKGAIVYCFIPDRHTDGYGLNNDAITYIKNKFDAGLIITVDCGITAVNEVEFAKSLGIEVIVTDHHNPQEKLPNCAIIDAKVEGETYPFKELCGAGVVAKIIHALCGLDYMKKFLDLFALATVTDLVPLVDENRIFVSKGLEFMNWMKRPGIQALAKYAQGEEKTESYHLGFRYGPMINAIGRLYNASDVVRLMTTSDINVATTLAEKFNEANEERKEIEKNILEECISKLGDGNRKSIILWSDEWESGVIGIVASILKDIYNCPVLLLSYDKKKGIYSGSGRSIDNINLFELLKLCSNELIGFGGHSVAAGLKVEKDKLNDLLLKFTNECNKFGDDVFEKVVLYDEEVKVSSFNKNFFDEIKLLQPCGLGNPSVKLYLKNVSIKNVVARGKLLEHFSCNVFDETANCDAICFNSSIPDYLDNLDIVANISINNYNGKEKIVCNIETFTKSSIILQRELASKVTQYGIRVVEQPLQVLGISDKKIEQFNKNGIFTVRELINYLPKKYLDFRKNKTVAEINGPELCSMIGTVTKLKQGPKMSYAMCKDENGNNFMACWFHQDYVLRMLYAGYKYIFCGNVKKMEDGFVQIYPIYWGSDISKYQTIIPEYKKIKGMSQDYLISSIDKALQITANTDYLDSFIVEDFNLLSDYDATRYLHHPKNDFEIRDGQRRKVFDDLFQFNFRLKSKNNKNQKSSFILKNKDKWEELKSLLPYNLTNDQENCINEIYNEIQNGNILNALVQGDVGSGKTMVAIFSMLLAANNGYQSCVIAPTEVLALQHYKEISDYMNKLGYNVGYLSGSLKVREKKAILNDLKNGVIDIVVGTHAVIQDSVEFNNLALVVIDEQHRFGVKQREKLAELDGPHMISMSATPIPRTLSMALYGDNIKVYNIKEKPAGRKDVITIKVDNDEEINMFMLEQIRQGRQCYVVCPLIEDSEAESMAEVHSVKKEVEKLYKFFETYPEVKISNTTGKMKKEVIAEEIDKFVKNETNILVSTTIIEVGVNVPNATVIVIKSSERFGLAQAHQLRGRVGRGNHQSYCILQTQYDDAKADILCSSNDGFEIARQDLLLRGSGDYIGTQQTGNNKNVMLMMSEPELYKSISLLNDRIYSDNALFSKYSYLLETTEAD